MATTRKDTDKTVNIPITVPRGVTGNPDGSYTASSGSPPGRRQHTFDTIAEAKAWKACSDKSWKDRGVTISKEEWNEGTLPGALVRAQDDRDLTPIRVRDLLPKGFDSLKESRRKEDGLKTVANILEKFLNEKRMADKFVGDLGYEIAEMLPKWLHGENHGRGQQKAVLSYASSLWDCAVRWRHAPRNPFAGLKPINKELPALDRRKNPRITDKAPAWTPAQLVAISFLLRPIYRLPFWFFVLTGIRRGEFMGLQLRNWNPITRDLFVENQRRGSAFKGLTPTKTDSSRRPILVCRLLAGMIDAFIAETHPPQPTDPTEREAWLDRYMFLGVQGGAMNAQSMCDAVKAACNSLGLDPTVVGAFLPLHHMRATLGSLFANPKLQISGRAQSIYLGHKVAAAIGENQAAGVTRTFYQLAVVEDLEHLVDCIQGWAETELLTHLEGDLLRRDGIEDGVDLKTAAHLLNAGDRDFNENDVRNLIMEGRLHSEQTDHTGPLSTRAVIVSAAEVNSLLGRIMRDDADTYCKDEVAKLLAIDPTTVLRLVSEGVLTEVASDPSTRVSARGFNTGTLPGGGRRYDKSEIDLLVAADPQGIARRREWLTVAEAAARIGVSTDKIRALGDQGVLTSWRNPLSRHNCRLLEPASVLAYEEAHATLTVADAAMALDVPSARIRALVKTAELHGDLRKGTVLRKEVYALLATHLP